MTIWDCFDISKFSKQLDNDKGVTRVLTQSDKGCRILMSLTKDLAIEQIDADLAVKGVKEMFCSVPENLKRHLFFEDLQTMPPNECFNKYFPVTLRQRFEKYVRIWSYRLGIYMFMKRIFLFIKNGKEVKR